MSGELIVFGDDHSTHADRAWQWINGQRWPGWSVDVVTAVRDHRDRRGDEQAVHLEEWQPDAPRTASAEAGIATVRHLRSTADSRVTLGSVTYASLLVVGPKGVHGVQQLFVGSTAEHLLRHSPAPLVIATAPTPATRVLVCTDGSPSARRAVQAFAGLPLAADADHVTVVGVGTVGMYDDCDEIFAGVDAAAEALAALGPETARVQSEGNIAGAVLDQIFALRAQLVVVGTRGRTGVGRLLVGSTARAIVHAAPCSVLVVPPAPTG